MYSVFQKAIISLLVAFIIGYFGMKFFWESDFEKLDKTELDLPKWYFDNVDREDFKEEFESSNIDVQEIYSSLSGRFSYYSHTEDFLIVGTSYNTLDDGLWFFATPTYTSC